MFNLLFMLQRLFMLPIELLMSPFSASKEKFNENGRSRAMMMGLPAVIVGLMGIGAIAFAASNSDSQEARYNSLAERANQEKTRLKNQIDTERRMSGAKPTDPQDASDPRSVQLRELHNAETIYLEKLIFLNPEDPDYRYRLARAAQLNGDMQRCRSLMTSIAPDDEPGYAKAHLFMAQDYMNRRVSGTERRRLQKLAMRHADHCLVRDNTNIPAKIIKVGMLKSENRNVEAYKIYEELFDEYPRFFREMVKLNRATGNQDRNSILLDQAQSKFVELIRKSEDKNFDDNWPRLWVDLIQCLVTKKDFEKAENYLVKEEVNQANLVKKEANAKASSRHVHIKQLLTRIYTEWSNNLGGNLNQEVGVETQRKQLDLLKKALSYDPKNARALQLIARISTSSTELAEEAKKIYDPVTHEDAPAAVLNEMGTKALTNKQYNDAIKYFELAREKNGNDPVVLNNLAYTYLVCENANPDRALSLVNQAIRVLPQVSDRRMQLMLASNFFDTKGRAFMQMNRYDDAAASFEQAMQVRPKHIGILEALVKCYEGRDEKQAAVYQRRIDELKAEEAENENNASSIDNPGN